jgi:hypothetical protein
MGKGYLAYVVIGLAAVVAISIVASSKSTDATGQDVIPIIIGSVAVFMFGLLALQWRGVMRMRAPEGPDPNAARAGRETGDAGNVTSPEEMVARLATEKYDEAQVRRGRSGAYGVMRLNQIALTIVVPVCLFLGYLGATGKLPNVGEWKYFRYLPFMLAPIAFGFVYLMISRASSASADTLAPLGLTMTETPRPGVRPVPWGSGMQSDVRGATVMEGKRHGRSVEVRMDGGGHTTTVAAKAPEFEIGVKDDRLVADEAPASIAKKLEGIGPSKHWKKLKSVKGGPDGIVAERKVDTQSGWLWDLWLCEKLAAR